MTLDCYHTNRPVTQRGDNDDVLATVCSVFETERWKLDDYVSQWRGLPFYRQCLAVFDSLITQVAYKLDPIGTQLIKTPGRLLADRCGDCKSMTVYLASCMWALGADKVIIRFVSLTKEKIYTHVYCIACKGEERYIMDAVERDKNKNFVFNWARPFVHKKDFVYER